MVTKKVARLFLKFWPNSLAEPNVELEKNCENVEREQG